MRRMLVPEGPLSLDEVAERWPRLRQSFMSSFDTCALSALFDLRYGAGVTTHPQARGTIFHRAAAEIMREMQRNDAESCPPDVGLAILEEVVRQRDVPPEEIVRVTLKDLAELEWVVVKFCRDNAFSIRKVLAIERRLDAPITYRDDDGVLRERILTGQVDALIAAPPDEAVIIDYKDTWSLPPEHDPDDPTPGIEGYFQQRFYTYLVLKTFPSVNAVTLREFYPRRTKAREARIVRADLPKLEARLSVLTQAVDRALAAGPPRTLKLADVERHGGWKPSPGLPHCRWCVRSRLCPIDDEYTVGGVRTEEDAMRLAAVREQAKAIYDRTTAVLKPWVDLNGPVQLKRAKGRAVLGYKRTKSGLRFSTYVPEEADRLSTRVSRSLADAMREAAERARSERGGEVA